MHLWDEQPGFSFYIHPAPSFSTQQSVSDGNKQNLTTPGERQKSQLVSDLLGDFAGALDQLFLGERVVGVALQGSSFGHQSCATETQLTHLLLNVRANLGTEQRDRVR